MKILVASFLLVFSTTALANTSVFTTVNSSECSLVREDHGGYAMLTQCPSHADYNVFYQSVDLYGWIILQINALKIDAYQLIITEAPGFAPMVGDSLEWRYNKENKLIALIFSVEAVDRENPDQLNKIWMATCIQGDTLKLVAKSNDLHDVRRRADRTQGAVCGEWLDM